MLNKLRSFVKEYGLVSPGDHITVALSGGKDSVALLFAMYLLKDEWQITVSAAHFNHHLRGEESQRDQRFVQDLCARYDIPLTLGEGWVQPGEKGLEAAAREARYTFFRTLPGKIATAHTADDNAETVLLRMLRGTGLKGLGAIAPQNGNVIRPLLGAARQDVEDFLVSYSLPHVEDSTNGEDAFLRNRVRHDILPMLRRENPRINQTLSSMALLLRQDEACLAGLVSGPMPSVSRLREMEPAVRRRYLDRFLKECGIREPEQSHILQAERLVFHWNPSACMNFPDGIVIGREYDALVRRESLRTLEPRVLSGAAFLSELNLWVTMEEARTLEQGPDTFTVVPEGALRLRCRQSGDSICLPGGTRSLKKLFIDRKIPADRRGLVPVLYDNRGILGVLGIGADHNRKARTLPALTIRFVSNQEDFSQEKKENGGNKHG